MINHKELTRVIIEQNTIKYYRTAVGTRPDLRVVEIDDRNHPDPRRIHPDLRRSHPELRRRMVVKDFRRSDPLFRLIVGPILIRREFGAMRNLIGLPNVPQIICRLDRYALVMEHVAGTSLDRVKSGQLTAEFYAKLGAAVDAMHERGVAHCDLRSRGNVMVGDNGEPYLVDFSACVFRGRGINPFFRWLFSQFVLADNNAVLRIKQRLSPELLTDDDREELARPLPFERPARVFGETVRNLTRKLLTRRNKLDN